ncbi:MAG: histidine--tRNA ligase [Candidatus Marsarchaeota archaeon]|nr:histidine--tRNA ligase [Candidatus Marsarchaeota archaeon]
MTSYQTPKGMRDYSGASMERRRRMANAIEATYRQWGYQPLWTPAMESVQALGAKKGSDMAAGAEIAGQLFKIEDSDMALRFDLTVPLARFAASQTLPKPYKRYAIAPVWRREEPQKGRLREFLQADADIIGSPSMRAEAELLAMAAEALKAIGISEFEILLNNRKILQGLILKLGLQKQEAAVLRALDKLDKLGSAGVGKELDAAGLAKAGAKELLDLLCGDCNGDNALVLEKAEEYSEDGANELTQILEELAGYGLENVRIDLSLVRGLGYYTGPIFEIRAGGGVGSVAGGGRYDGLLGLYGQNDSAVGISFGIERLLALQEENEGKKNAGERAARVSPTQVFIVGLEPSLQARVLAIARELREDGLCVETDLNGRPMRKQLDYASATGIPFALFVGKKEVESGKYALKDLKTGQQKEMTIEQVAEEITEIEEEGTD